MHSQNKYKTIGQRNSLVGSAIEGGEGRRQPRAPVPFRKLQGARAHLSALIARATPARAHMLPFGYTPESAVTVPHQ
ncbi:hypothetical protein EVAR_19653_1 [Eumeta japonica]|uniref:Uncharacterized protein n=1 Tax=Eumeta variegata TaxID=151549 RepID=A0A4C1V3H4_EUMVA|nr:hypothetical protein EVAR_19653_1 [Eumeta japonica]